MLLFCSEPSTASLFPHYKVSSQLSGPQTYLSSLALPMPATLAPLPFIRPTVSSAFSKLFLWAGQIFLQVSPWAALLLDSGSYSKAL